MDTNNRRLPSRVSFIRKHIALILILLFQICLSFWLIKSDPIIGEDEMYYIQIARILDDSCQTFFTKGGPHPGFPALIAVIHQIIYPSQHDDLATWENSARVVSVVFGLITTIGIWVFCLQLFRSFWVRFFSVLLFVAGRKYAVLCIVPLTDMLSLSFMIWTAVTAVYAYRHWSHRHRRQALVCTALSGIFTGLGYLVRPEAVGVFAAACVTGGILALRKKIAWKSLLTFGLVGSVLAAGCILPYMLKLSRFQLTPKQSLIYFIPKPVDQGGTIQTTVTKNHENRVLIFNTVSLICSKMVTLFAKGLHPLLFLLMLIWIITLVFFIFLRKHTSPPVWRWIPLPHRDVFLFVIVLAVVYFIPSILRLLAVNVASFRYILIVSVACIGFAGAGFLTLARSLYVIHYHAPKRKPGWLVFCLVGTMLLIILAHTLRPLKPHLRFFHTVSAFLQPYLENNHHLLVTNQPHLEYLSGRYRLPQYETVNEDFYKGRKLEIDLSSYHRLTESNIQELTQTLKTTPNLVIAWQDTKENGLSAPPFSLFQKLGFVQVGRFNRYAGSSSFEKKYRQYITPWFEGSEYVNDEILYVFVSPDILADQQSPPATQPEVTTTH